MTVVVAFLCSDGVVIAADSMLTPSMGNINVGHHKGLKVEVLQGPQVFAFAGDHGQGSRFKILAEANHTLPNQVSHPIDFPLALAQGIIKKISSTGILNNISVNTALAFLYSDMHHCCVFEGALQPRLLDKHHYYVALGSGKLSADPFLRFVVDVFCRGGQPNVREAVFLATWTVQHAIDTSPGGVAGPIRIAILERDSAAGYSARELPDTEIDEHQQAIESAVAALRQWRDALQSGAAAEGVPEPPTASDALS